MRALLARPITPLSAWLALLGSLAACGTDPRIPSALSLSSNTVSLTALGQTQQLTASVTDQDGKSLPDAAITWSSSDDQVLSVTQTGLVTAEGVGSATITAAAGSASAVAEGTVVQTPAQIQKIGGDGQTGPVGQPLPAPLTVELRDALGNTVPGANVSFTVTSGAGTVAAPSATTGADGRASTAYTIGTTAGPDHQVSAVSLAASVSAVFLATATAGPAATLTIHAGNGQVTPPGTAVLTPPAVRVIDAFNNPVSGISVEFEVATGGGSVSEPNTTTDATGVARAGSWTLGSAGQNTLTATVSGVTLAGNPVTFTATAAANTAFNIEVRFQGSATASQQQAFADAEARWQSVIIGELPNVQLAAQPGDCGENSPAVIETIDDVVILATVEEIDGPLGTLAQAGPCYIRTSSSLTILGLMRFDEADLADIEAAGALSDVILHEMGHVLGIGTVWELQDLLADPVSAGGIDPHFTGTEAIAAFDDVGGTAYAGGKVPVETEGGDGTADSHWRESVMDNELMTGFVSLNTPTLNPLSLVTIASLEDQGYSVSNSAADPYSLTPSLRATTRGPLLDLGDDRLRVPLRLVDTAGRIVQVIRR